MPGVLIEQVTIAGPHFRHRWTADVAAPAFEFLAPSPACKEKPATLPGASASPSYVCSHPVSESPPSV